MKKWQKVLSIILLLIFVLITYLIIKNKILFIDKIAIDFVNTIRTDKLTTFMTYTTYLAEVFTLLIFCLILFIVIKNKKISLSIIFNISLSALLTQIIKRMIKRTRPLEHMIIKETGYSFPSGHSMACFSFYGYLIYLVYKYFKNQTLKIILYIILSLIILLIGVSRIYLGVHYASDVIGSFVLSGLYLIIYTRVINKYLLDK